MDENVQRIEERFDGLREQHRQVYQSIDQHLTRIEVRLEQTATRADLDHAVNVIILWIVGTVLGTSVAAIAVLTAVLANAMAKPTASPAPIIIQLPPQLAVPSRPP